MEKTRDLVLIPRWVIRFQAALLGVCSITFFIFGLMTGALTSGRGGASPPQLSCQVLATVDIRVGRELRPAAGAVAMLLPAAGSFPERLDGKSIHPNSFQPLDNPVITQIGLQGGAIARCDEQGRFRLTVDSPGEYWLAIATRTKAGGEVELQRGELAALSRYFLPVESVYRGQRFRMTRLRVSGETLDLGTISL